MIQLSDKELQLQRTETYLKSSEDKEMLGQRKYAKIVKELMYEIIQRVKLSEKCEEQNEVIVKLLEIKSEKEELNRLLQERARDLANSQKKNEMLEALFEEKKLIANELSTNLKECNEKRDMLGGIIVSLKTGKEKNERTIQENSKYIGKLEAILKQKNKSISRYVIEGKKM